MFSLKLFHILPLLFFKNYLLKIVLYHEVVFKN